MYNNIFRSGSVVLRDLSDYAGECDIGSNLLKKKAW